MRLKKLALLGITALGLCAWMQSPTAIVFVLAGQSNMVGFGSIAELDDTVKTQPANVEFYLEGEQTSMASQGAAGPEFTLAAVLSRSIPNRKIVLIKYARSGTSLLAWAPDWEAERAAITENHQAGPLYENLLDQVRTITQDKRVELGAVFWMQGERDARYPAAAAEYEANLVTFIEAVRRDLHAPGLPFIYGQVNPPSASYQGAAAVRLAQNRAERRVGNAKLVSTDGLTKGADGVHYDAQGQMVLGRRFAEAYLELRKK